MADSLVKIDEEIVTSAVASVTLTGINSTYDVYVLVASGLTISVDTQYLYFRVTKDVSGTTETQDSANYDYANKLLKTNTSFSNFSHPDRTSMYFANSPLGNSAGENSNIIYHLYNFNNASEYSFVTVEENCFNSTASSSYGSQGGLVYTVAEAHNGITITGDACNITGGTVTLYGLKK